jgi:hypothetical protein
MQVIELCVTAIGTIFAGKFKQSSQKPAYRLPEEQETVII